VLVETLGDVIRLNKTLLMFVNDPSLSLFESAEPGSDRFRIWAKMSTNKSEMLIKGSQRDIMYKLSKYNISHLNYGQVAPFFSALACAGQSFRPGRPHTPRTQWMSQRDMDSESMFFHVRNSLEIGGKTALDK